MGGSNLDVRRLHQLLSARAYLRAALYNIRMGRMYLDSDSRKDFLVNIEESLEAIICNLDKEIGFMVYGPLPEPEKEKVKRLVEETVFGSSSVAMERSKPEGLPVVIKR